MHQIMKVTEHYVDEKSTHGGNTSEIAHRKIVKDKRLQHDSNNTTDKSDTVHAMIHLLVHPPCKSSTPNKWHFGPTHSWG